MWLEALEKASKRMLSYVSKDFLVIQVMVLKLQSQGLLEF